MEGKHPKESAVGDYVYKIFPNDLNSKGTVFGGTITALLDRIALVIAERHSSKTCVTVSIDAVHFLAPAKSGDNLIIQGMINRSWNSSMEIGLKVSAENPFFRDRKHILSAYFTFVALDEWGRPAKVPDVSPQTHEETRRFEEAAFRKKRRFSASKEQEAFRKEFKSKSPPSKQ